MPAHPDFSRGFREHNSDPLAHSKHYTELTSQRNKKKLIKFSFSMLDPTFPSVYYFGIFSKAHIIKINKNNLPLKILYPLLIKERGIADNRSRRGGEGRAI